MATKQNSERSYLNAASRRKALCARRRLLSVWWRSCVRRPPARPPDARAARLGCDRKRLLSELLGDADVAEEAIQGRETGPTRARRPVRSVSRLDGDLDERADLNRTAEPYRRNPLCELERRVQVGRLEHVVAPEHLLGVGVRPVRNQILGAPVANRGRRVARLQVGATDATRVITERRYPRSTPRPPPLRVPRGCPASGRSASRTSSPPP